MSVHSQPLSTLTHLRGLLEVSHRVRDEHDLERLVDRIAETISESLGFATVAINLYRPAEGDFRIVTVHGNASAREALLGSTRAPEVWEPFLAERFFRRGAYLIPHDAVDWERMPSYVPDLPISDEPDAWHPEDALIVPMRAAGGDLLGVVSVDEPASGLRPGDEELDVLVAFAEHVAAAIEAAQDAAAAARDRLALVRLLDVSASLVALDSVDAVLAAVAHGISDALGFERVAVCHAHGDGFVVRGAAGWEPDDPGLGLVITPAEVELLFVPEFEREGCYLVESDVARALVSRDSPYASRRGGAGPRAWSRHWLLVPLTDRDGVSHGFVWVDDPTDDLLPSPERLQALRTFANQATTALRAAIDFETLTARNGELAALHDTAFGLLEGLELDRVLTAIVESASSLVAAPNAYLYVSDHATGDLRMQVGLGRFASDLGRIGSPGKGVSGKVLVTGETVVVDDYRNWPDRLEGYDDAGFRAVVGVPLRAGGELVGVIGIARQEARPFDSAQVALLERFAGLASLALENARLYEALQQSEELHRRIVENSTDLITLIDLEGVVVVASPAALRTLDLPADEFVGVPFGDLVHPDDLDEAWKTFSAALAGEVATITVRARHGDGGYVLLEATAVAVPGPDGAPQHVLTTSRDVTERHRLEEQLRQAQKLESVGRLAGGIAHDFNNLLTAIRGYAELLLLDLDEDAAARESAAQIARAADRAAALTSQLLAFSRKQVLRPQLLDLNEVVEGMTPLFERVLGDDVLLTTVLEPGLGRTLADPTQVEQVILNLALNARDAMRGGGGLLVSTANVELEDERYVTLVVADTGSGMDEETAARAFEPFFTTKDVGAGTGLGLATVHGIVAQSGGSVGVVSEPGVGTTFTVRLPLAD
ncbi:MAG TPA: GAF domain-containing protein [Gaiellaceae bacterium]|nr:GAF domain-containing protein [Gaiellaceae bacterium]